MNPSNRFRDRWITGLNCRGSCGRAAAAVVVAACGLLAGWGHERVEAAIITQVTFPSSPTLLTATPAQMTGERSMTSSRGWFGQTVTATSTFRLEQIVLAVNSAAANADFEFGIWQTSDVQAYARPTNAFPPVSSAPLGTSPLLGPLLVSTGSLSGTIALSIGLEGNERILLDESQGYFFGFRSITAQAFTFRQTSASTSSVQSGGRIITDENLDRDTALALNGTLVPEPSGLMLIGIGAASALLLGRRRRARPATA